MVAGQGQTAHSAARERQVLQEHAPLWQPCWISLPPGLHAGEHVTEEELVEHLMTLLGHSDNPEVGGAFSSQPEVALQELPERVTATQFAEDLLGLTT